MSRKSPDRLTGHVRLDGTPKVAWPTWRRAEKHAEAEFKRFRTGAPMDVYPCRVGGKPHFHTGRKRGRRSSGGWK
jgi:hypothetical protein